MRFDTRHLNLDTELGQAFFRFSLAALFALYLFVAHSLHLVVVPAGAAMAVGLYLLFAGVWVLVVAFSMVPPKSRCITAIFLDQALFAFGVFLGGKLLALVIGAPILISLGNGLRSGPEYAKFSAVIGATLLAVAMAASPFWRSIPLVPQGIVLATFVIPWYAMAILERITLARRKLEQHAATLETTSRTDVLTGLLNRSGFGMALDKLMQDVVGKGNKCAVMLLDLDGFKTFNDAGGHRCGDIALQKVALCLRRCVRNSDQIGRIGGDEFGIVICNLADDQNVEALAMKILEAVGQIKVDGIEHLQLGASIGACVLPNPWLPDAASLMDEADRLMYEAKRAGKNQFRTLYAY